MTSKYKEVYDLVVTKGFSPAFVRNNRGQLSLYVYPKDYKPQDSYFYFEAYNTENLKKEIEAGL
jgi:hypothetical protein